VTFGNGSVQSFAYDAASRLDTLTNNLGGAATTHDLAQTFTYNPAGQIASVARSNDAYAWAAHYNVDRAYVADGLNRIMSVGSTSFGYDARGNLTSDGTNSYVYNSENLMTGGPGGAIFKYDALGRLQASYGTGAPFATRYEYDGVDLITEFDAPSTILRRYVHGPGIDNPIAWYEGSAVSSTTRRFLMADERGSVVSITDSAGATLNINSYDEYGIPAPGNVGRFGYTGQTWLPEIGMWYYKARLYSPTLGRFMQSDPIGYSDGMNWYNYVGGDPVNFVDPLGLYVLTTCIKENWVLVDIHSGQRIEGSEWQEDGLCWSLDTSSFFGGGGGGGGGEGNVTPEQKKKALRALCEKLLELAGTPATQVLAEATVGHFVGQYMDDGPLKKIMLNLLDEGDPVGKEFKRGKTAARSARVGKSLGFLGAIAFGTLGAIYADDVQKAIDDMTDLACAGWTP
jgi:RHS repeat-associated protein